MPFVGKIVGAFVGPAVRSGDGGPVGTLVGHDVGAVEGGRVVPFVGLDDVATV